MADTRKGCGGDQKQRRADGQHELEHNRKKRNPAGGNSKAVKNRHLCGIENWVENPDENGKRRNEGDFFEDKTRRNIAQGQKQNGIKKKGQKCGNFILGKRYDGKEKQQRHNQFSPRIQTVNKGLLIGQLIEKTYIVIFFVKGHVFF